MADAQQVVSTPSGMQYNVPAPANIVNVPIPGMDLMDPALAAKFATSVAGMAEAITQPFYSAVNYPAAGAAVLNFFNNVPGNPVAITAEDTNMQTPNTFPSPTMFLIQGIAVDFLPGVAAARFGAESANGQLLDYYTVMSRGVLIVTIANKPYFQCSNMLSLPHRAHINGVAAVADQSTIAASLQTMVQVGFSDGPVFTPRPLLVPTQQNVNFQISYPLGLVPVPSANATSRMFGWLSGTQYRPVQ